MELFDTILAFMDKGGNVLWIIATLVFFMWTLIIERFIYFLGGGWKADRLMTVDVWEGRAERKSWNAKQIRVKLLSESRSYINDNMSLIATCVPYQSAQTGPAWPVSSPYPHFRRYRSPKYQAGTNQRPCFRQYSQPNLQHCLTDLEW